MYPSLDNEIEYLFREKPRLSREYAINSIKAYEGEEDDDEGELKNEKEDTESRQN